MGNGSLRLARYQVAQPSGFIARRKLSLLLQDDAVRRDIGEQPGIPAND
jgi:hypothetical protein